MASISTRSTYLTSSMRSSAATGSSISASRRLGSGSVYGGAGGSGVRISKASLNLAENIDIALNEKAAMQNLNDRLASYLDKVRQLEAANGELELKIRKFLETKTKPEVYNFSIFEGRIKELQDQISIAACANAALYLAVDNAKLASDDFKVKYDSELAMRQSVEADIAGLKKVLEELGLSRTDVELLLESLNQEQDQLKAVHQEDLLGLQTGGQVNVEVDAAPQDDLSTVLAAIRGHYENLTAKNRKDLEAWFQTKTVELNKEAAVSSESLQTSKSEVGETRRTYQTLEIKLQAQNSRKAAVEETLTETRRRFAALLAGYQRQVGSMEGQLVQLRADLENQGLLYSDLLDLKTRLELEIKEYRRLLDGESEESIDASATTMTRVVTIVQEVDSSGNVLSMSSSSDEIQTQDQAQD